MLMSSQTGYESRMFTQHTENTIIPFLDHLMVLGRNGKGYCWLVWDPIRLIMHKIVDGGESMRVICIVDGSFTQRTNKVIDVFIGGVLFGSGSHEERTDSAAVIRTLDFSSPNGPMVPTETHEETLNIDDVTTHP